MAKAKKKAAKQPSTALAVRKKVAAPKLIIEDPKGLMPQTPVGQLGELATVGALGLAELKLTADEERVLAEPVNVADVLTKPGKGNQSIPYLPHIVYTRWFNRAFGRTGWSIVPTAAPKKVNNLILVPYLLYIHGVPVAAATGEQDYHENNAQQTYGDVIESTVASALRRCAKRLGIGLEMWDERWLEQHFGKRAARAQRDEDVIDAQPVEDRVHQASAQPLVITNEQRKRLTDIAQRAGRESAEVQVWLKKRYGYSGTKDISRAHYAEICQQLQARGPLTMPGDDVP